MTLFIAARYTSNGYVLNPINILVEECKKSIDIRMDKSNGQADAGQQVIQKN